MLEFPVPNAVSLQLTPLTSISVVERTINYSRAFSEYCHAHNKNEAHSGLFTAVERSRGLLEQIANKEHTDC